MLLKLTDVLKSRGRFFYQLAYRLVDLTNNIGRFYKLVICITNLEYPLTRNSLRSENDLPGLDNRPLVPLEIVGSTNQQGEHHHGLEQD